MKQLTDEMVKKVIRDAAEAVRSSRLAEAAAKAKHAEAVGELVRRGYQVRMQF